MQAILIVTNGCSISCRDNLGVFRCWLVLAWLLAFPTRPTELPFCCCYFDLSPPCRLIGSIPSAPPARLNHARRLCPEALFRSTRAPALDCAACWRTMDLKLSKGSKWFEAAPLSPDADPRAWLDGLLNDMQQLPPQVRLPDGFVVGCFARQTIHPGRALSPGSSMLLLFNRHRQSSLFYRRGLLLRRFCLFSPLHRPWSCI